MCLQISKEIWKISLVSRWIFESNASIIIERLLTATSRYVRHGSSNPPSIERYSIPEMFLAPGPIIEMPRIARIAARLRSYENASFISL